MCIHCGLVIYYLCGGGGGGEGIYFEKALEILKTTTNSS